MILKNMDPLWLYDRSAKCEARWQGKEPQTRDDWSAVTRVTQKQARSSALQLPSPNAEGLE